jgi:phospholipid/cholesterol/gamma-HCH transport system substrate-binding protein
MMKRSNDWIVGVVVLTSMVVIVAATMFLQQLDLGTGRSTVIARFRDVGNMQVGNQVVIRGVLAGRVEEIALAENGWVTAELSLSEGIRVPRDPVVMIQAATLFGEWQAVISSRSGAPAIREVLLQLDDTLGAPPATLAGAVLPDIAQLTSVAGGIAGNVASVAERVRVAFDDSAARELRSTIRNFNQMSSELAAAVRLQSRNLNLVAEEVRGGVGDLSAGAAALQRSIGRLDSATSAGEVQSIIGDTRRAAANMLEVSTRLQAITLSLERAEVGLRGVVTKADTLLGRVERGEGTIGLLVNDPSLYRNSDSLVIDLRAFLADFRRNPKRYVNLSVF